MDPFHATLLPTNNVPVYIISAVGRTVQITAFGDVTIYAIVFPPPSPVVIRACPTATHNVPDQATLFN